MNSTVNKPAEGFINFAVGFIVLTYIRIINTAIMPDILLSRFYPEWLIYVFAQNQSKSIQSLSISRSLSGTSSVLSDDLQCLFSGMYGVVLKATTFLLPSLSSNKLSIPSSHGYGLSISHSWSDRFVLFLEIFLTSLKSYDMTRQRLKK